MPAALKRCPSAPAEFDEEGRYERHIQAAFQAASASLLGLLQRELGLRQTLTALKQYMLLSQGDMLGAFLDSADEELQKSAVDVSEIRLQSLLDLGEACGCSKCNPGLPGRARSGLKSKHGEAQGRSGLQNSAVNAASAGFGVE